MTVNESSPGKSSNALKFKYLIKLLRIFGNYHYSQQYMVVCAVYGELAEPQRHCRNKSREGGPDWGIRTCCAPPPRTLCLLSERMCRCEDANEV